MLGRFGIGGVGVFPGVCFEFTSSVCLLLFGQFFSTLVVRWLVWLFVGFDLFDAWWVFGLIIANRLRIVWGYD